LDDPHLPAPRADRETPVGQEAHASDLEHRALGRLEVVDLIELRLERTLCRDGRDHRAISRSHSVWIASSHFVARIVRILKSVPPWRITVGSPSKLTGSPE